MKKVLIGFFVSLICLMTLFLAYDYRKVTNPKLYYRVYLNDEVMGVISSKSKLQKIIDAESSNIKNKYGVKDVHGPLNLVIEELTSYDQEVSDEHDIYRKIIEKDDLTIDGYQISIKYEDNTKNIYVTEEEIFKVAATDVIKTFVGKEKYESYINDSQDEIVKTGSKLENVYIQNDITIKKTRIPVSEKIYTKASDLSRFLLYGSDIRTSDYIVKLGDTISSVAYANEISAAEFLIANSNFTDVTNLLHVGEVVTIAVPNPQIQVVSEEYQVLDKESSYVTVENYDPELYVGTTKIIQEGQNGIVRVSQNVQTINGSITFIEPISREEIKQPISKIVTIGSHKLSYVGDPKNWGWPTISGYTITDNFEWRTNPITGQRERHSGIDISGTGYGSPVYSANNGEIITKKYKSDYGNYIVIDHHNGYKTLYAHLSRFANVNIGDTVAKGQVIGYVGSTGWSTGPHLHFEVWKDCDHCRINPLSLYR